MNASVYLAKIPDLSDMLKMGNKSFGIGSRVNLRNLFGNKSGPRPLLKSRFLANIQQNKLQVT